MRKEILHRSKASWPYTSITTYINSTNTKLRVWYQNDDSIGFRTLQDDTCK
jgi:hypothetical protein